MCSKKNGIFLSILIIALTGCSQNIPPVQVENQDKAPANSEQFPDKQFGFDTKSLDVTYITRKIETFLKPGQETKLVKELLYAGYKYPDLAREMTALKNQIYYDIIVIPQIIDRRKIDPVFDAFILSLAPRCSPAELLPNSMIVGVYAGEGIGSYYNIALDGGQKFPMGDQNGLFGSAVAENLNVVPDGLRSRVAYEASVDGRKDVYVSGVNGCDSVNLSSGIPYSYNTFTAFSPDSSRLAIQSDGWPSFALYTVKPDNSGLVDMNAALGIENSHSAYAFYRGYASIKYTSPDGKLLVSNVGGDFVENNDIYKVNFDGTDPVKLTTASSEPVHEVISYSASGNKIAYSAGAYEHQNKVYLTDSNGQNAVLVDVPEATNILLVNFSPDESKIVIADKTSDFSMRLWVAKTDGTGLKDINAGAGAGIIDPTFTDNDHIVYMKMFFPQLNYHSFLINSDGTGQLDLTPDASFSTLNFISDSGDMLITYDGNMFRYNSDGSGKTPSNFPELSNYLFSGDRTKMFFAKSSEDFSNVDIYSMDIDPSLDSDGTNIKNLTNSTGTYQKPYRYVD
jgi:hypothetical protein